jgi:glycosyltransferase involved in cell wall biosynthesis
MHVRLVTAAPPGSEYGSETTAIRWEHILSDLGHDVDTTYVYGKTREDYANETYDLMITLCGRECDEAIQAFKQQNADRPIVVALTDEDVYIGIENSPTLRRNIELADALVVFHDSAVDEIPHEFRDRTHVIEQGVELPGGGVDAIPEPPLREARQSSRYRFEIAVAGHVQERKDPLRTALAARVFSDESQLFVTHTGRVMDPDWEEELVREHENNPRYDWIGDMSWTRALQYIKRADLISITSKIEGAANVISESIVVGTPVVATDVPGHRALLGDDYPGLFEPENEEELAKRIGAAEGDERYYQDLQRRCDALRPDFSMSREADAWKALLDDFVEM